MRIYRTEYIDLYKTIKLKTWDDVLTLGTTLLRAGYNLKITAKDKFVLTGGQWVKEYSLDFRHKDYDYIEFEVADKYKTEIKDDVEYTYVRQGMGFVGSDPAMLAARTLVENDYEVVVWTDGETFGEQYPKHYTVEFVHKSEGVGINERWF